jgi:hypothetical protein
MGGAGVCPTSSDPDTPPNEKSHAR